MEKIENENIIIQHLTSEGIDEVLQIEKVSYKDPWTRGMFLREIGTNIFYVLKEKNSNQLIGYFGYWHIFDEFHITNLTVALEYRQQGIGSFILNYLLSEAKRKKCQRVILEVGETNSPAQGLYTKFGFEIIGKRKKYYANGEDALILEIKI